MQRPVTTSPLGPNTFLSTPFPYFLNLPPSLSVTDQVAYPSKLTDKITGDYILVFTFHIANGKTKDFRPNGTVPDKTCILSALS